MTITSRFLKDISESAEVDKVKVESLEADVPTHPSDASTEVPDDAEKAKKVSKEAKPEVDAEKVNAEMAGDGTVSEEKEEDEVKMSEEMDSEEEMKEEEDSEEEIKEEEDSEEEDEVKEEELKLSKEEEEKIEEETEEEVKEATDALTKDEELPESFKTKVSAIFESAVKRTSKRRADAQNKKLIESYNKKLESTKQQISETLVNKVDGYLDYVVEEWMKENKVAIESSLRSEITENFITGLKGLFESHYIDVPVEKVDVLSEQEEKIKSLEKELNDELVKNVELRKENKNLKKSEIIKKLTEGLTVSEASKFTELCEGVSFDDNASFSQKLKVIKETYFPTKTTKSSRDIDADLLIEGGLEHTEDTKVIKTEADLYAEAISRMVKR